MTNAKKLLAAILTVIMVASLMTCFTFAATPVFAESYVSYPASDKIPAIKNTACIVSVKARNAEFGDKIKIDWDGQTWEFTAGVNAFGSFDEACKAADLAARGATPQVILSAGTYAELRIKSAVEVFGAKWNDNPNVVNTTDPTKAWAFNTVWKTNPTICEDIVIDGAAAGEITIVGMEIAHRFYDSFRPQSSTKTTLKLINTVLNQTTSKEILDLPTGRKGSMAQFAMSFWNPNSANNGASAANNSDETHLINFRIQSLNMNATSNRIIDERISPTFIIDGLCAEPGVPFINLSWFKWGPFKNPKMVLTNSYLTHPETGNNTGWLDFCGYNTDKSPDAALGETAEIEVTNNIFYNAYRSNGNPDLRIFGIEYSKITIDDNLFINSDTNMKTNFMNMYNTPIGDLTDVISLKNNTFLGFDIDITWGNADTKIDMTGTYSAKNWSKDYKTKQENVLPTGNVRYDYCYIDGAKTIRTDAVQEFNVEGMTIDHEAATIEEDVASGIFTKEIVIDGQAVCDIYESDKDYSNIDTYEYDTPVGDKLSLTKVDNYYIFVAFSPDRVNRKVYKMRISRPSEQAVELISVSENAVKVDPVLYKETIAPSEDSCTFAPVAASGATITVTMGDTIVRPDGDGKYTVTGIKKGEDTVITIDLRSGAKSERYTYIISRGLNSACELISVDSKLVPFANGYKAVVVNGQTTLEFAAVISEDATAFVTCGTEVYPYSNGKFVINTPKAATYNIIVVAENGTTKSFPLTLSGKKSSEAKVISVANATAVNGGFEASAVSSFKVVPTVSQGAGFKVFADAACTTLVANNTVTLADADVTVYIVVTAEDGTVANPVALKVKKTAEGTTPTQPQNPTIKDSSLTYKDVVKSKWYKEAVDYVTTYGFMNGTKTTEFGIGQDIDRGMFVTILARMAGVDTSSAANKAATTKFADVKSGKYYTAAVKWASDNGIVKGTGDTTFSPAQKISRQDLCVMIVRFAEVKGIKLTAKETAITFPDAAQISGYAKAAVKTCQMADIVNGHSSGKFAPQDTAKREEAAKILWTLHENFMK